MPDWEDELLNPKFIYLILGAIFISGAVVSMCTAKTIARYAGWVRRVEKPNDFGGVVAIYFLGGVVCIGIYLYKVYELLH